MKILGFLIFLLGAILLWFATLPAWLGWALITVGAIILIAGYIFKSRAS